MTNTKSELVDVYGRPARVEHRGDEKSIVVWEDSGTVGVVWTEEIAA